MQKQSNTNHIQNQLLLQFNQLFTKESLRKNVYIFKNLSEKLELPVKVIAEQRKVLQILNHMKQQSPQQQYIQNMTIVKQVLKKCQLVQLEGNKIKIKIQGDMEIVRLKINPNGVKQFKKTLQKMVKDIKHETTNEKNEQFVVQFHSNAAVNLFIERIKQKQKQFQKINLIYSIQPKDPYLSLKDAIKKYKNQKKIQTNQTNVSQPTNNIQNNYNYNNMYSYSNMYGYNNMYGYGSNVPNNFYYNQLDIFIRRAVNSSDEEQGDEKQQKNEELNTQFQNVNIIQNKAQNIQNQSENYIKKEEN